MPELFAPRPSISNTANVKRWVLELFVLSNDTTVMVTELRCSEPGCPPLETVIAILSESGNRHYKLHKSVEAVAEDDVRDLVTDIERSITSTKS